MRIPCGWLTYMLSIHCLPSFSRPTETARMGDTSRLFCHSAKREFSDPGPGLQILWSTRFHQVTVDYGSAGFLFHNVQDACMHSVCAEFNLLMGLRGLQPDALMIIFCEVVVMVWPRRQQLLCCLHMPLDQFGVCVLCSDGDNIPRTARIWTVFIRVAY